MKKVLTLLLGLSIVLTGLTACDENKNSSNESKTSTTTTTTSITTTIMKKPKANTTEMVDYLALKAKNDAETATDDDIKKAVKWIKSNVYNMFDNNENMENMMYYGELLEYKYKDSGNDLETVGWQAFKTVKYVYRGAESLSDESTQHNVSKLIEMLYELN